MRTIRNSVFETNSSSMHAISLATYRKRLDLEYLTEELERWKKEDGSYEIIIKCKDENLDEDHFGARRYVPHTSVNDKLIYWFACLVQDVNGKFYTLDNADYTHGIWTDEARTELNKIDTVGIEWKSKANEETYKYFEDVLRRVIGYLKYTISDALGIDEDKIEVKFYYVKDLYNGMIQGIDFDEDDWFSTGCYDNSVFFAHTDSGYNMVDWLFSPFSIIFASGDELNNYDMYADIRKASQAYKDRALANLREVDEENYYPEERRQKDIDAIESSLDFQVVFPVGG